MTLAGLLTPRRGGVELDETPIDAISDPQLRSRIAYFAEDAHIFATTVGDNLRVVRGDASDGELLAALSRVGLADWTQALPEGLSTVLTGGSDALSAGQRRRLRLARALIAATPIILLDEPTENLNAEASDMFLRALLTADGGLFDRSRTIVVATHHLPAGVDCERLEVGVADVAAMVERTSA